MRAAERFGFLLYCRWHQMWIVYIPHHSLPHFRYRFQIRSSPPCVLGAFLGPRVRGQPGRGVPPHDPAPPSQRGPNQASRARQSLPLSNASGCVKREIRNAIAMSKLSALSSSVLPLLRDLGDLDSMVSFSGGQICSISAAAPSCVDERLRDYQGAAVPEGWLGDAIISWTSAAAA